jgi:hypothetical protein
MAEHVWRVEPLGQLPLNLEGASKILCKRLRAVYVEGGQFPVHVVQENGLPDIALTVFANDLSRILSASSVRGYVRETLAFLNRN